MRAIKITDKETGNVKHFRSVSKLKEYYPFLKYNPWPSRLREKLSRGSKKKNIKDLFLEDENYRIEKIEIV